VNDSTPYWLRQQREGPEWPLPSWRRAYWPNGRRTIYQYLEPDDIIREALNLLPNPDDEDDSDSCGCEDCRLDAVSTPQPRDAVQFKLGQSPIVIDTASAPDSDERIVFVDDVEVIRVPPEFEWVAYEAARETARRIGQREQ
jgi:hypothetical protein